MGVSQIDLGTLMCCALQAGKQSRASTTGADAPAILL